MTACLGLIVLLSTTVLDTVIVLALFSARIAANPQQSRQLLESIPTNGLVVAVSSFATAIAGLSLISLFIKMRVGARFRQYLGFDAIRPRTIMAVLGLTAAYIVASDGLTHVLGKPLSTEFMNDAYATSVWPPLLWIAVVIAAPLFEESLFRGFLFQGFRRSRLGVAGTILLTTLVWASLHIQYDIYGIASVFALGIILGIVRWRTTSLWYPITMHMFANVIATLEVVIHIDSLIR